MLDQMFTAENFRRIYDSENRKGLDLASRFFPSLEPHTIAVRNKVQDIRTLRANETTLNADDFKTQLADLKTDLAALKAAKSAAIDGLMEEISNDVLQPTFKIDLAQRIGPKGKAVFCIDSKPETFFVIKQLQRNIHRIYGVKQANRHDLACQVRDTIAHGFPLELVRTDISSFYESIDRKKLLGKLDRDQLLSPASKRYIKQITDSYGNISSTQTGVPRGVGISAYLAELYLRPVDSRIKALSGLILYCRYVDDIVAVFARSPIGTNQGSFKDSIIKILKEEGLANNVTKTVEQTLPSANKVQVDYLGYEFILQQGRCAIFPSSAKMQKYESRLDAAFANYHKSSHTDARRAYRDLVARVKFLTGNTRLWNNKSRVSTGIYYNNALVNDPSCFAKLDTLLKKHIKSIKRPKLRARLKPYNFTDGFVTRRFHNFSANELKMIVRAWKHG